MKKLFTASITFDFVVVAEDENHAHQVAMSEMREALSDMDRYDADIDITEGVSANGWDDDCIPYGGDGNTRTKDYK